MATSSIGPCSSGCHWDGAASPTTYSVWTADAGPHPPPPAWVTKMRALPAACTVTVAPDTEAMEGSELENARGLPEAPGVATSRNGGEWIVRAARDGKSMVWLLVPPAAL